MKFLMCNLKSNKDLKEILEYKKKMQRIEKKGIEFVLFPSDIYLGFFYDAPYKIGCQNLSIYQCGSHTGETLASQLVSLKVSYCLLNHAEANDTLENVVKKIHNAFRENIKVVLCIGEEQKEDAFLTIHSELSFIFEKLKKEEQENIIIAYEPKWSIQKEDIADVSHIDKMIQSIKRYINKTYNISLPVLYGGGINQENIAKIIHNHSIDGFLIGSCANNPENVLQILTMI